MTAFGIFLIIVALLLSYAIYAFGWYVGFRDGKTDGYRKGLLAAERMVDDLLETNGLQIKRGR